MENKSSSRGRLVSLDALRGFDMFWIISGEAFFSELFKLSGNPFLLSISKQFDHSAWNGFTFYDLIFPLFLFISGASLPFSMAKRKEKGESTTKIYRHIIIRTFLLIFFGLLFNGLLDFNLKDMRYAGVLQRIGICYFFASVIVLNFSIKRQVTIAGLILMIYWLIMVLIPVPGVGAGVLTPEGNLSGFIDRELLYGKFCCYGYGDNEGLLSTIPAIVTSLLGVFSGHWLRSQRTLKVKTNGLLAGGVGLLILGWLWGLIFPINKLIWTSSYVLFAGGWSALLLALFFWVIDVRGYKKWAFPFVVIGLNPITIYLVQRLFNFGIIVNIFVHGFIDNLGDFKQVFYLLCLISVKWLFLYFLYKKNIFLKV